MPGFNEQSARRISRTVRDSERRIRGQRQHRARYQGRSETIHFELLEAYEQFSTTPALAIIREWDPNANGGLGGFTTDCTNGRRIKVWDAGMIGHNAGVGGCGRAKMMNQFDGYGIGHIRDLCCPGDEQGDCIGSGSGS